MSRVPWTIKYRPKVLDEVENQEDVKKQLREWIESWLGRKPETKGLLLYGPPGTGKTTLAYALARTYGLEIIETNASDSRNMTSLRNIVERASMAGSLFNERGKLIFLDEVDGIQPRQDFGAISAILEILRNTKYPILMAANDPWDPNLRDLREAVKMIEVKRLGKVPLRRLLKRICTEERIKCEDGAIDSIIDASDGDARYAINFLESIAEGYREVKEDLVNEVLRRKERELNPFETLRNTFWAKYGWQARQAVSNSQIDYDLLMRWFSENIPVQYESLNDMWRAYDALSRASVFLSRAKKASWDMLSYTFDLMGPGVAMAEVAKKTQNWKAKWKNYQFPQLVTQLYRTKRTRDLREQIVRKIGLHLHTSSGKVYSDVLPFALVYLSKEPEMMKNIDLSPEEINFAKSLTVHENEDVRQHIEKKRESKLKRNARRAKS